ncbi:MAG: sulfite exporter TauE/SafE family protein [Streptosporangiaceae bacterium]
MHVDPYIVLGSAVVGLLVGLTGAGGGALMTPMLILLFGVKPSTAISSDLVAAVLMRPFGAAVHLAKRTVNLRLVGWMTLGSVPMAFVGAYLLHLMGGATADQKNIELALGAALLVGAGAMVLRYFLDRRGGNTRTAVVHEVVCRPVPTVLIGMIGGVIVGMTSVGSGSLMIVLLLFLYPVLSAGQLVGTDLTQAVPLTLAAALGALAFGHVEFAVTASIVIGSVPAVLVGSFLSSRAPDRYIRPIITFVIFASGLKYVGVGTTALGWILCAVLLVAGAAWLAMARPWQGGSRPARLATAAASPDGIAAVGTSPPAVRPDGAGPDWAGVEQDGSSVTGTGRPMEH